MRVLEVGTDSCGGKIPSTLGDFIHLRYLRIERGVTIIPAFILTLQNLETIDLGRWHLTLLFSFPGQIWKLKNLRHLYTQGPIRLQGRYSKPDEVMWNLQTMNAIDLTKQTSSLINVGTFPNLKKLGLQISRGIEANWPMWLQSLQQLRKLSNLRIAFQLKISADRSNSMGFHIGCEPREVLHSIGQLNHVTELKINNALDILTCRIAFPPNVRKLTLTGIGCMTDEGMNALGNLTKLQILRLHGRISSYSFDLNCVAGGFPQLQVLHMTNLKVKNWKLEHGAMLGLRILFIDHCKRLNDLPHELWSLIGLRKVLVRESSESMANMLQNLEIKDEVELKVVVQAEDDADGILAGLAWYEEVEKLFSFYNRPVF